MLVVVSWFVVFLPVLAGSARDIGGSGSGCGWPRVGLELRLWSRGGLCRLSLWFRGWLSTDLKVRQGLGGSACLYGSALVLAGGLEGRPCRLWLSGSLSEANSVRSDVV